jgi:hypothetical protein
VLEPARHVRRWSARTGTNNQRHHAAGDGNITTTERGAGPPGVKVLRDRWAAVAGNLAESAGNPKTDKGRSIGDMAVMALRRQSGANRIMRCASIFVTPDRARAVRE